MILGHEDILESLKRLAREGLLSHGYLFWGQDGVGKKIVAKAFAAYLEGCQSETNLTSTDLFVVEPGESQSIGIDAIRDLKTKISQKPLRSLRRVAIIDNADLLTSEAQNALLKITEEPFPQGLLILIASDAQNLLPTLQSRLQKIYFAPLPESAIAAWLTKECAVTKTRADELAAKCFGRPGLALRMEKDEKLKEDIALVTKLLLAPDAQARKTIIKTISTPDDFSLSAFVDVMVLVVSWRREQPRMKTLLSALLQLRVRTEGVALSPRIQLESVFQQANIQ